MRFALISKIVTLSISSPTETGINKVIRQELFEPSIASSKATRISATGADQSQPLLAETGAPSGTRAWWILLRPTAIQERALEESKPWRQSRQPGGQQTCLS